MHPVTERIREQLGLYQLEFTRPPLIIGGMAMEYYGMRKAGADMDLLIPDGDYAALAARHPDTRKDIYGDLGVVLGPLEIWRSIALLDYGFYGEHAAEEDGLRVVSLDRLLFMRVIAMEVPKYREDINLMKQYYYAHFCSPDFAREARTHAASYRKSGGTVFGGKYAD